MDDASAAADPVIKRRRVNPNRNGIPTLLVVPDLRALDGDGTFYGERTASEEMAAIKDQSPQESSPNDLVPTVGASVRGSDGKPASKETFAGLTSLNGFADRLSGNMGTLGTIAAAILVCTLVARAMKPDRSKPGDGLLTAIPELKTDRPEVPEDVIGTPEIVAVAPSFDPKALIDDRRPIFGGPDPTIGGLPTDMANDERSEANGSDYTTIGDAAPKPSHPDPFSQPIEAGTTDGLSLNRAQPQPFDHVLPPSGSEPAAVDPSEIWSEVNSVDPLQHRFRTDDPKSAQRSQGGAMMTQGRAFGEIPSDARQRMDREGETARGGVTSRYGTLPEATAAGTNSLDSSSHDGVLR